MDRTLASLDATLEGHAEGVRNAAAAGSQPGLPELEPFVRETATSWPEPAPAPLAHDAEELDRTIFAALVSPYV
jgi:hypothetical protein